MLRERYEQIRQRAIQRTGISIGSEVVMRRGMRSWMEACGREDMSPVAPAFPDAGPQVESAYRQIAAVWADVLVGQAERS